MSRKPDPYGRDARRPYHIPLRGWWQVAQRVWTESGRDNLSVVSAGCAFFALFAIFPALSALIALYGLTANPATVEQQFGMLADVLPAQAYDIVIEQVRRLVQASGQIARLEPLRQPRARLLERHGRHAGSLRRAQHRL